MRRPDNDTPSGSALKTRFNLRPFLAGRHMVGEVYGTMDTTFEWPLKPSPLQGTINPVGTAPLFTVVPIATGVHSLVVHLSAQWPDAAGRIDLMLGNTVTITGREQDLFHCTNNGGIAGGQTTPIIGAHGFDTRGMLVGLKAVYVPEGERLIVLYTSAAPGDATVTARVITVPSTQPFNSLFNYS